VSDLVLVGPGGAIVDTNGNADPTINISAYNIHSPIHAARPEIVCAAHTHTPYGTPWSANAEAFQQIVQEATAFFERHAVYDGEDVNVQSTDGGKRIAVALGEGHGVILRDHALFDDFTGVVLDIEEGKRIGAALGEGKAVILRNHGLLTVGGTVDEAIGWFIMMERVAEVHVKAHRPQPIGDEAARTSANVMAQPQMGWHVFNWALRARIPDPRVVD
jgi:ribulose-5-phosphate 4-epimerase/fuculose-1-phosphate aldolase